MIGRRPGADRGVVTTATIMRHMPYANMKAAVAAWPRVASSAASTGRRATGINIHDHPGYGDDQHHRHRRRLQTYFSTSTYTAHFPSTSSTTTLLSLPCRRMVRSPTRASRRHASQGIPVIEKIVAILPRSHGVCRQHAPHNAQVPGEEDFPVAPPPRPAPQRRPAPLEHEGSPDSGEAGGHSSGPPRRRIRGGRGTWQRSRVLGGTAASTVTTSLHFSPSWRAGTRPRL